MPHFDLSGFDIKLPDGVAHVGGPGRHICPHIAVLDTPAGGDLDNQPQYQRPPTSS